MLSANRQRFEMILSNVLTYHPESKIVIEQKRDTRTLKVDNQSVCITSSEINLTGRSSRMNPSGLNVIKTVKKSFYEYINTHINELEPDETGEYTFKAVKQKHSPIYTNKTIYNALGDLEEFYLLDLKHAFWRIAFLQGYISEELYKKQLGDKETKLSRNMALACVIAHKKRIYYQDGQVLFEVSEVCKPIETMYANIRHICYNAVGDVQKTLAGQVFACRTDAVYVKKSGLEQAKKMLYNKGFLVKTVKCIKINENYFADENDNVKKI